MLGKYAIISRAYVAHLHAMRFGIDPRAKDQSLIQGRKIGGWSQGKSSGFDPKAKHRGLIPGQKFGIWSQGETSGVDPRAKVRGLIPGRNIEGWSQSEKSGIDPREKKEILFVPRAKDRCLIPGRKIRVWSQAEGGLARCSSLWRYKVRAGTSVVSRVWTNLTNLLRQVPSCENEKWCFFSDRYVETGSCYLIEDYCWNFVA